MAITKSVDTPMGVAATYWIISRAELNIIEGKVWFVMNGYASQQAFQEGKDKLIELPFTADADPQNPLLGEVSSYIEGLAQVRPPFSA